MCISKFINFPGFVLSDHPVLKGREGREGEGRQWNLAPRLFLRRSAPMGIGCSEK
jgi:hypothetical protein